jgi:hypothetical protein
VSGTFGSGCYGAFIDHSDPNAAISAGAKTQVASAVNDCDPLGGADWVSVELDIEYWSGTAVVVRWSGEVSSFSNEVSIGGTVPGLWALHRSTSSHDVTGNWVNVSTDWE